MKGGELLLLYLHPLRACITPTAPTFQGSLARPACMVALLTLLALLQGSLAHPAHSLMHIVNNASSLRTCITPTAPLSGLGTSTFQGSLARPACMVALLTLLALLQGSLARPVCRAALLTLPGQPCSPRLHGSLAHPARSLAG